MYQIEYDLLEKCNDDMLICVFCQYDLVLVAVFMELFSDPWFELILEAERKDE